MQTEIVEFRFPDGDFEVDSSEHVPEVGAVFTKQGRVWKVDAVAPGSPTLVTLALAPPKADTG